MKILLTGATGFVGSYLVERFLQQGYELVILKRTTSIMNRIKPYLSSVAMYNSDEDNLDEIFSGYAFDVVVHTATSYGRKDDTDEVMESNLDFPLQLVDYCIQYKVPTFINTDSYFAKKDNTDMQYLNTYINTKIELAQRLRHITEAEPLRVFNIRLEHVFGARDSNSKFTYFLMGKLLQGETIIPLTLGEQKRDFIYIEDVSNAYVTIIDSLEIYPLHTFTEYEVGLGKSMSIRDFVEHSSRIINSSSILDFGALPYRDEEIMESVAHIQPLLKLGWHSNWTVEEGIKQMVTYMKDEKRSYKKTNRI